MSDHVWAHWDVLPTLADIAGARTPAGLDGMSMARALRGEPQPSHPFLYWEFHERGFQQAVRMERWKAVRLKAGAPLEVYDLEADPGRAARRRRRQPGRRREDRGVPQDGENRFGSMAGEVTQVARFELARGISP